MGENSKIEWTDHTFNPWIGCTKVSDGCKHCYAEQMMDKRLQKAEWGPLGERIRTGKEYWMAPSRWNRIDYVECALCCWRGDFRSTAWAGSVHVCPLCGGDLMGVRQRVFVASLSDVCDDHSSIEQKWRNDLLDVIYDCQRLDFLFLTKRPDNFAQYYMPQNFIPDNIWLGVSVENQKAADERIPDLVKIPAVVKFLSCEPLLENVDLGLRERNYGIGGEFVNWVICGGESGTGARPMSAEWARSVRDQCVQSDVPFLFKQWGGVNKKSTGRLLDGVEWNQFPEVV